MKLVVHPVWVSTPHKGPKVFVPLIRTDECDAEGQRWYKRVVDWEFIGGQENVKRKITEKSIQLLSENVDLNKIDIIIPTPSSKPRVQLICHELIKYCPNAKILDVVQKRIWNDVEPNYDVLYLKSEVDYGIENRVVQFFNEFDSLKSSKGNRKAESKHLRASLHRYIDTIVKLNYNVGYSETDLKNLISGKSILIVDDTVGEGTTARNMHDLISEFVPKNIILFATFRDRAKLNKTMTTQYTDPEDLKHELTSLFKKMDSCQRKDFLTEIDESINREMKLEEYLKKSLREHPELLRVLGEVYMSYTNHPPIDTVNHAKSVTQKDNLAGKYYAIVNPHLKDLQSFKMNDLFLTLKAKYPSVNKDSLETHVKKYQGFKPDGSYTGTWIRSK